MKNSDAKAKQYSDSSATLQKDIAQKSANLEVVEKDMHAIKSSIKNTDEETKLKQIAGEVDKEIYEADLERNRLKQNDKRFVDLKRRLQKEIATA